MPTSDFLTGKERFFDKDSIIVSKTDLKGRILYANKTFLSIADFTEEEVLDQPHSILRHPEMPRCVFKLLWDTISEGREIFAYVVNRTKGGDHYWVLAHVTPSFSTDGRVEGYHSNRRVPDRRIIETTIAPLYGQLLKIEKSHSNAKEGLEASHKTLVKTLADKGISYDQFIFSL